MNIKEILSKEITKKVISIVLLLTIALLSIFVVSKVATSPESYTATIQSIDEKKATVMALTATTAAASTGLATIPGDATTPIANQIMEISSYLLIVVCVLVLEKSLLTVMGFLSFNILIPMACGFLGVNLFIKKDILKVLAVKFIAFALVIVTIIPFSLKISDMIYEVNKETIETVAEVDISVDENEKEEQSWWEKAINSVKDSATKVVEQAKKILNEFIDAIAIFIITYCAIPLIVVIVVIFFLKFLFGITVPMPKNNKTKKSKNEISEG